MRNLKVAYGNSRNAKKWSNKTICYDDLKNRLRTPIRTTETMEEYAKMNKAQRDAAKDHGGFVGGALKGGLRRIDCVDCRSLIALIRSAHSSLIALSQSHRIPLAFIPHTAILQTTRESALFSLSQEILPQRNMWQSQDI